MNVVDYLSVNHNEDVHYFTRVSIILRKTKNAISAKERISNLLCDFNKPFNLGDGSKLFFKNPG